VIALTTINVINSPNQAIDIEVTPLQEVGVNQDVIIHVDPAPPYEGAYVVTPKLEAQTMPTKNKVLNEDMTVKGIEIHRVKNSSGGTTVYIARGD
jgi:hypothetical protein